MSKARDIADSAATINVLDGVTATATELNYVDGVTSAIQTQLDGKETADATIVKDADIGSTVQAYDSNLTSFVGTFTLPTSDGTADQVLTTNGSGVLSFGAGGSLTPMELTLISGSDVSGSSSIEFTSLSGTYDYYLLFTHDLNLGSSQNPTVSLSLNNGTSYPYPIAAGGNSRSFGLRSNGSWSGSSDSDTGRIWTNSNYVTAHTYIWGLAKSEEVYFTTWYYSGRENAGYYGWQNGRATTSTNAVNAMKYQFGNTATSGAVYLYGVTI